MPKKIFQKVGQTPIIPISIKLVGIFVSLLFLSNFATNFLTLQFTKRQLFLMNNTIMTNQLKEVYTTAGNQYQIALFTKDRTASVHAIELASRRDLKLEHSRTFAVDRSGHLLFSSAGNDAFDSSILLTTEENPEPLFCDFHALENLNDRYSEGILDGSFSFSSPEGRYIGVYKYQSDWDCYFVRAELRKDTIRSTLTVLGIISIAIVIIAGFFIAAGLYMFKSILQNVSRITDSLYEMQKSQHLSLIDLSDSPNDDVTYLAASFNSLSSTISNLMGIFQKFVSKDVVAKAYREHTIRLEGSKQNLTMLFSDIKSFTYRTETLGTDIIDLLNVHYDRVIHAVHENSGVVGSIIGDAILAVYGTSVNEGRRQAEKSLEAVDSAWEITRVTSELRQKMIERKAGLGRELTQAEERVYQAVLIDVGVGIDGGNVFYGNIGSDEHMTNTVIGDRVNSASRLEGLTRIYSLPVIVSEYIKNECQAVSDKYEFYEVDKVFVKGKTEGVRIYFPFDKNSSSLFDRENLALYNKALYAYYDGNWNEARKLFKSCKIETASVFLERMGKKDAPENWSGIWTMTTK